MTKPEDCQSLLTAGIKKSGEYVIWINGVTPTVVNCDMVTEGGGWTVFQRRMDGSTLFYRGWDDYKRGFGNKSREYWLGLEAIHELTSRLDVSLRIDLTTHAGTKYYSRYTAFSVDSESTSYKLYLSGHSGNVVDYLSYSSGASFSTNDRDNDQSSGHCAIMHKSGWWMKSCFNVNLNNFYSDSQHPSTEFIYWYGLPGIKFTEMKIRGNIKILIFGNFTKIECARDLHKQGCNGTTSIKGSIKNSLPEFLKKVYVIFNAIQ